MRPCLLDPIPELELAAKLLDAAADALLLGRPSIAADLLVRADIPEIGVWARTLVGRLSKEVHRQVHRPRVLAKDLRDPTRMPGLAEQQRVFAQDGWRCRFCGIKVICKAARAVLVRKFPELCRWRGAEFERHFALYAMASSLDHIEPHSRGGANVPANFVTTCYCCQFGRGEWLLDEVEVSDPRLRTPRLDAWDGLARLADAGRLLA